MTVFHQPYHLTLLAFLSLADIERVDRLVDDGRALTQAFRTNHALNAPELLKDAWRAHEQALDGKTSRRVLTLNDARDIAARMEAKLANARWTDSQPLYGDPHGR